MKTITIDLTTPADPAAQIDAALGIVAAGTMDDWIVLVTGQPQGGLPKRFRKTEQDTFDVLVLGVSEGDAAEAALGRLASRVAKIDQRSRQLVGHPLLKLRVEAD